MFPLGEVNSSDSLIPAGPTLTDSTVIFDDLYNSIVSLDLNVFTISLDFSTGNSKSQVPFTFQFVDTYA